MEAEIAAAVASRRGGLGEAGMSVRPVTLPSFEHLNALRRVVMLAECAAFHRRAGRHPARSLQRADRGPAGPGFALSASDYCARCPRVAGVERF